jgi:hypothetical protein
MGATSTFDKGRGVCVSTGKLAPAGEEHVPQWGRWLNDQGKFWYRWCNAADWCENQDLTICETGRPPEEAR